MYFKSNKKIRRAEKYKMDVRLFYLGLSRFFGGLEAVFGVGRQERRERRERQKTERHGFPVYTGNDGGRGRGRRAFFRLAAQGWRYL